MTSPVGGAPGSIRRLSCRIHCHFSARRVDSLSCGPYNARGGTRMRLNSGLSAYQRRRSRVVHVGDVALGGDNPIRVQSMTTPATTDTTATVSQIARSGRSRLRNRTRHRPDEGRCRQSGQHPAGHEGDEDHGAARRGHPLHPRGRDEGGRARREDPCQSRELRRQEAVRGARVHASRSTTPSWRESTKPSHRSCAARRSSAWRCASAATTARCRTGS